MSTYDVNPRLIQDFATLKALGDQLTGNPVSNAKTLRTDRTANYTLATVDDGLNIPVNSASNVTITLNTGMVLGFNCRLIQKGAGTITVSGTATLNGALSTSAQWQVLEIIPVSQDVYVCKVY
ncbi:MAG TPA: hypothetical protein VFM18_12180 [Methanosarcina sp.]|nr:hypothetical protein [Methanosarcina sp.]